MLCSSLDTAYRQLLTSFEEIAQAHITFADNLTNEVANELKVLEKRKEDTKKIVRTRAPGLLLQILLHPLLLNSKWDTTRSSLLSETRYMGSDRRYAICQCTWLGTDLFLKARQKVGVVLKRYVESHLTGIG